MSRAAVAGLLALLLAACDRPVPAPPATPSLPAGAPQAAVEAVLADEASAAAVAAVEEATGPALVGARVAVEAAVPEAPPAPPVEPLVAAAAVELIVEFEIGSRAYYDRRLKAPIWPGGASGVTWCIGYDGGHQTHETILREWVEHMEVERLATTAGITGSGARNALVRYKDIRTEYPLCEKVFSLSTLVEYERRAARAFGDAYDLLHPLAKGALVSLVYNRGASMVGDSRREMKMIRDTCVPAEDYDCIAAQIYAMKRLWRNSSIEAGMTRRRDAEAALVLLSKDPDYAHLDTRMAVQHEIGAHAAAGRHRRADDAVPVVAVLVALRRAGPHRLQRRVERGGQDGRRQGVAAA